MLKKVICVIPLLLFFAIAPVVSLAEGAEEAAAAADAVVAVINQEETEQRETAESGALAETKSGETQVKGKPLGPASETAGAHGAETGSAETGPEGGDSAKPEKEIMPLSYTEDDLYVMAHVLAGECQSCPDEEQLYVGSVVLNRKAHPSFPNTIRGVVFQKGQYSCTRDGNYYREPTQRNWDNARRLLETGSVLPGNVIWQSGRRQGRGVYIKTRWHYYCY